MSPSAHSSALLAGGTLALALLAIAAIPIAVNITAIENRVSDAGYIGALPGAEQRELSAYLIAHQDSARYELAAESATGIGSLIVQDARPVVVLTTYEARVFTSVAKLKRLIAEGTVRYAFLNTYCGTFSTTNAACASPAQWIRAHGTDVSIQAGLGHHKPSTCFRAPNRERLGEQLAGHAGDRRPDRRAIRVRHGVHGRGPLPHAAVPDPARGSDGANAERSNRTDRPARAGLGGAPLAAMLADPAIQTLVHAGRQDVALVRRRFATEVRNVFDTQIAAGFAGLGAQSSYDTLLAELLDVRLAKSASFTRWDTRPLSPEQLGYAREDVVHLLELAAELERRLTRSALEWAREECRFLELLSDERDLEAVFARLPRIRGLSPPAQTIARELVEWRERTAANATGRCRASSAMPPSSRSPSASPPRRDSSSRFAASTRGACTVERPKSSMRCTVGTNGHPSRCPMSRRQLPPDPDDCAADRPRGGVRTSTRPRGRPRL